MTPLLDALAVHGRWARRGAVVAIWFGFSATMVALAVAQALVERRLGLSGGVSVVIVAGVWAGWTYWHSFAFLRHRERYLAQLSRPYRRALVFDLYPGMSVSFSQMLRSSWNGANLRAGRVLPQLPHNAGRAIEMAAGWLLAAGAFTVFSAAWLTLGTARVGFVPEFVGTDVFVPLRRGPYRSVRHPLFWSGIGLSCALALISGTATALAVAAVNFAYGIVYNTLEDRRLGLVFGQRYSSYAREVPHIIPARMMLHGVNGQGQNANSPLSRRR
ncbi:MAG TPA: methyltransferase [Acidimicrobiales bacterium]|nr:methyltransferase [Acidimicrobiales bacterium]